MSWISLSFVLIFLWCSTFFLSHVSADDLRDEQKRLDEMCLDWSDICYSFNKCCVLNVNPITSMDRWKNYDFNRCCINVVSKRVMTATQIEFNWLWNAFEWALLWSATLFFYLMSISLISPISIPLFDERYRIIRRKHMYCSLLLINTVFLSHCCDRSVVILIAASLVIPIQLRNWCEQIWCIQNKR